MTVSAHQNKPDTHASLLLRMQRQEEDVHRLVSGLGEAELSRRTVAEKWSLKELAGHLWRVQQVFAARVQAMLQEENPRIHSYSPDGDTEFEAGMRRSTIELVGAFARERAQFAEQLRSISREQWHRRGQHPDFPHYDVHFQVEYMLHHEAHHLYQMFQRRVEQTPVPH